MDNNELFEKVLENMEKDIEDLKELVKINNQYMCTLVMEVQTLRNQVKAQ